MHGEQDWSLTDAQYEFLKLHYPHWLAWAHAPTNTPEAQQYVDDLAESSEFKTAFGDMSFDEAFDRMECALEYEGEENR